MEHEKFYPKIYAKFREAGVILVILPNLSGSKINGATKKIGNNIMLMVKDRRLYSDTFWFTLLHEIGHIINKDYGISFEKEIGEQEQLGIKLLDEYPDQKYDIIVDAIFGVGLKRDIRGIHQKIIEKINDTPAYVVSIDIPSGVSATTGQVMNVAVKADLTVTMGLMKVGMVLYPGCACCGEILVKDKDVVKSTCGFSRILQTCRIFSLLDLY